MYIFNAGKILIEFYFPPIIIFICLIIWSLRVGWSAEPRLGEAAGGRAAVRLYPRRQNRVCPHQQQDQDPRHIQLLDLNLSTVVIVVVIYHVIIVAGGHGIFWHKVMGCILSITGGSLLRPHFLPPQSYLNCCRCLCWWQLIPLSSASLSRCLPWPSCWKKFWPLVLGCVLRTAGSSHEQQERMS